MGRNKLYCELASKGGEWEAGVTSQSGMSPNEDRIRLYSGKSGVKIKVSFIMECVGGHIPTHAQLEKYACRYIACFKMAENLCPWEDISAL